MLHVGCFSCTNPVSERRSVICFGSLPSSDMSTQQAGCLKHLLHWAWRCTHARLREAHDPGGVLLGTYRPPYYHGCSLRHCTQYGRSRTGSMHAANVAQTPHGSTVLLVESPAKAKKLQLFLGNEYKVQSSLHAKGYGWCNLRTACRTACDTACHCSLIWPFNPSAVSFSAGLSACWSTTLCCLYAGPGKLRACKRPASEGWVCAARQGFRHAMGEAAGSQAAAAGDSAGHKAGADPDLGHRP